MVAHTDTSKRQSYPSGLAHIVVLAASKPHGVRLRYMAGCRCLKCRMANSNYETMRARARKAGDWNGGDGFHIGAEHDQFYVYATDTPLEPDEVKQLVEWGWFQPELEDDAPYDPEEGWSAWT